MIREYSLRISIIILFMNQNSTFFRIAFSYTDLGTDGKTIKAKKHVIVSAVNYTDAETVAVSIIPDLQTHSDNVDYEIKRVNKKSEFILTPAISINGSLTEGLINYYLAGEEKEMSMFNVYVEFQDVNDKGKLKTSKEEFLLATANSKEAFDIIQNFIKKVDTREFMIKDIKFEPADELFVTDSEHKSYVSKSESNNIL